MPRRLRRALLCGVSNSRIPGLGALPHVPDQIRRLASLLGTDLHPDYRYEVDVVPEDQTSKAGLTQRLELLARMKAVDEVLIYLSGHGVNKRFPHYAVAGDLMRLDEIMALIGELPQKIIVVIFDFCHSGAAAEQWDRMQDLGRLEGLQRIGLLAATCADAVTPANGPFTEALIDAFKKNVPGKADISWRDVVGHIKDALNRSPFGVPLARMDPFDHLIVNQRASLKRTTALSPRGTPRLSFKLGSIHIHVDGAEAQDVIKRFRVEQNEAGRTTDISSVQESVSGDQRKELPDIYAIHTPGSENEELDYFSTTLLHSGPDVPDRVGLQRMGLLAETLLSELDSMKRRPQGIVVELERVVGTVDETGAVAVANQMSLNDDELEDLLLAPAPLFLPFRGSNIEGRRYSRLYELHFSLDIALRPEASPPQLDYLLDLTQGAGVSIPLGGWFSFQDDERWAFRSNSFAFEVNAQDLADKWRRLRARLDRDPDPLLREAQLRLVAEEALAAWKTPLTAKPLNALTVGCLAEWESQTPDDDGEFWVALPNFLGDRLPAIAQAMAENFARRVRYLYFLSSYADAKRWGDFKSALIRERKLTDPNLMQACVVSFRSPGVWINRSAFVANPRNSVTRKGVRLQLHDTSNEVRFATSMSDADVVKLIGDLTPPFVNSEIVAWSFVLPARAISRVAAVCVNLAQMPEPQVFETMFSALDSEVAQLASEHGGKVVLLGNKSISVVFEHSELGSNIVQAVNFAAAIIRKVKSSKLLAGFVVRAGIDYGIADVVPRSVGQIWTGDAVRGCRAVLYDVDDEKSGVALTQAAIAAWSASGNATPAGPDFDGMCLLARRQASGNDPASMRQKPETEFTLTDRGPLA